MSETAIDVNTVNEKLDNHLQEYEMHQEELAKRHKRQDEAYENTLFTINELASSTKEVNKSVKELSDSTKGVVEIYTVVTGLQRFFKWLSGFAVAVVILVWIVEKFIGI